VPSHDVPLAEPGDRPALVARLREWLPDQRWFQGKALTICDVAVVDTAVLRIEPPVVDFVLAVSYAGGRQEYYQVPLLDAPGDGGGPRDALVDPVGIVAVATAALRAEPLATARGATLRGMPVEPGATPPHGDARPLGVEQSNSSVVVGDALLKVFRRLEEGPNPDVELTRALTAAGFAHVPAQRGALVLERGGVETTLAVVSDFAAGAEEGWALACGQADGVHAGDPGEEFVASIGGLGSVVGDMHALLRDAFGHVPAGADVAGAWATGMLRQADEVFALARGAAPGVTAPVLDVADAVLERLGALALLDDTGPLIRVHGDLHLGQVLRQDGRWLVLDFEGEPARPLAERRRKQSPLRDVAGMLRSFDYAAANASPDVPPVLAAWRDGLRAAFLDGYVTRARPSELLPTEETTRALLDAFELHKAVYELGYELSNRPEWVSIPVGGILRVLDGR
jgi:trehalose synthase-fused probable maltokinase